jgi:hypothetical protein
MQAKQNDKETVCLTWLYCQLSLKQPCLHPSILSLKWICHFNDLPTLLVDIKGTSHSFFICTHNPMHIGDIPPNFHERFTFVFFLQILTPHRFIPEVPEIICYLLGLFRFVCSIFFFWDILSSTAHFLVVLAFLISNFDYWISVLKWKINCEFIFLIRNIFSLIIGVPYFSDHRPLLFFSDKLAAAYLLFYEV